MRVLFFGTSQFALPALQSLHDASPRHIVLGVVTQPDRPSGRGMKLHFSPIKELAVALGYPVMQPERVRRKSFLAEAAAVAPEALVVVSFGQIIPQALLDMPRHGGINVHASLLPRWRGAAPIHHAIIAGDSQSGVATMQMEATLDTGPVYYSATVPILPNDTVASLESRLSPLGGRLLVETLDAIEAGRVVPTPQSAEGMTYASPVTRGDGLLDPQTQTAAEMERRVRGASPRPGAYLLVGNHMVRVLEAKAQFDEDVSAAKPPQGSIRISKQGIRVSAAEGQVLLVTRLQPENKAAMNASDWARGARLNEDSLAVRPSL